MEQSEGEPSEGAGERDERRGEEKNLKGSTGCQAGTLNGLKKIAGSTDFTAPSRNYYLLFYFFYSIVFLLLFFIFTFSL